ncbi:hypothetical protein F0562_005629 [Nyssa sinensis]|uniref:Uncharacterized protein n=1 Tax=Nyssa sinensis TaxID=561372 RepID=A0A5J5AMC1_9ASTE|nr:hypothetical protein F0562_005629 [Nyssa sinensis]
MSSVGASCARVYVQQKHCEEKMKRMEEERARSGEGSGGDKKVEDGSKGVKIPNFPAMSSVGASCAKAYVQQKHSEEKMKKMEEERARSGEGGAGDKKVDDGSKGGKSKKIHPGSFPPKDSTGNVGETSDSVA